MSKKHDPTGSYPPLSPELMERVDRAWDALEDGDIDSAGAEAEEMMAETDEHPEVRFLLGAALLESGEHRDALKQLLSCDGIVEDQVVHRFYLASALYENLRVEEASEMFKRVAKDEDDAGPPWYGLAECYVFLGRYEEAEAAYEEAHRLEPEDFPLPVRMTRDAFEAVVAEAIENLPEELRKHLQVEVPVVVEPMPTRETRMAESEEEDTISPGVLGLFVGPNLKERSSLDTYLLPPTIFIYQRNLERFCMTQEELIHEIQLTLHHELGHYLGLEEEELHERGLD